MPLFARSQWFVKVKSHPGGRVATAQQREHAPEVHVAVTTQAGEVSEPLAAIRTAVRFVPSVPTEMPVQAAADVEPCGALRAAVRTLLRVRAPVLSQGVLPAEPLVAHGAIEGLVCSVIEEVPLKITGPAKLLAALCARELPLPRVRYDVVFEVDLLAELHVALLALEGLLPSVDSADVLPQGAIMAEPLLAHRALVRLLARVHAVMLLESCLGAELFGAQLAGVGPLPRVRP